MTRRGKTILVAHFILAGYVLIQVSWDNSIVSYQVNAVSFLLGAVFILGGCLYLLVNARKKSPDTHQFYRS